MESVGDMAIKRIYNWHGKVLPRGSFLEDWYRKNKILWKKKKHNLVTVYC